jgi:hypothetical protein
VGEGRVRKRESGEGRVRKRESGEGHRQRERVGRGAGTKTFQAFLAAGDF